MTFRQKFWALHRIARLVLGLDVSINLVILASEASLLDKSGKGPIACWRPR